MYNIKYSPHSFDMRSHGVTSFYGKIHKTVLKITFINKSDDL
jgi:hypothetical protein